MTVRRKHLNVVKLGKPKIADDTSIVASLVSVLAEARKGKIKGYAVVILGQASDGGDDIIMSSDILTDTERLLLLGGIERLKAAFMAREWPQ